MLSRADARRRTDVVRRTGRPPRPSSGWGRGALRRTLALTALAAAGVVGGVAASAGAAWAGGLGQQVRAADMTSLRATGVPAAWRVSQGSGVLVGVLDTGADLDGPWSGRSGSSQDPLALSTHV